MDGSRSVQRRWIALAAIAVAFLCVHCGGKEASKGAGAKGRPPPLVTIARVELRDVPVEVTAPVDLRPVRQADVGSKVLGYLDAVFVDVGDSVKKGQLLALVNPSELTGQVASIRGSVAQTEASLTIAKANYDRAKQLVPQGVVSQQELEQARAAFEAASANRTAIEGSATALGARLGETRILSPMDGYVFKRRLDPGALVGTTGASTAILTLVKTDVLRVFIAVGERDAPRLSVGLPAHVEIEALGGKSFLGSVVRIAPAFDPATRTVDVEVHLANDQALLRPGMYGRGSIVIESKRGARVIPVAAVQFTESHAFAFVHQNGKATRREVKVGVDGGQWLEITAGLEAGEEVLTGGYDALGDSAAVRVAAPPASSSAQAH